MTTRTSRRKVSPEVRRIQNLIARYKISQADYDAMVEKQNGLCALCGNGMKQPVVDHDHQTGQVRGILCHGCNIKLPIVEDMGWVMLAWAYLEGS